MRALAYGDMVSRTTGAEKSLISTRTPLPAHFHVFQSYFHCISPHLHTFPHISLHSPSLFTFLQQFFQFIQFHHTVYRRHGVQVQVEQGGFDLAGGGVDSFEAAELQRLGRYILGPGLIGFNAVG
ncbi:MAG: hypothetical protein KDD10_26335, partial [Phaeodactylibacter sp.]|nr:hypothetical protein [Phaeodactylibacter sp.]